jgi:hypothetical protein
LERFRRDGFILRDARLQQATHDEIMNSPPPTRLARGGEGRKMPLMVRSAATPRVSNREGYPASAFNSA